jgi:thermitase
LRDEGNGSVANPSVPEPEPEPDSEPPQVTLGVESEETVLSGTVLVEIAATDNVLVVSTEFHCNGELLLRSSDNPLQIAWDTTAHPDGLYLIQGAAVDSSGNAGYSPELLYEIVNTPPPPPPASQPPPEEDTTPPVVQILSPADGSDARGNVRIEIVAKDDVALGQIQLWINGNLEGTSSSSPAVFNWNINKGLKGENVITAAAFDHVNNWAYHMIRVYRK